MEIHPKIIKNHGLEGLGGSWGGLGEGLGAILAPRAKKSPTSDSLDPPWPPKLEPKFVKKRHVGILEGNFVNQSDRFGGILRGSHF